jgi:acyl carrier protein
MDEATLRTTVLEALAEAVPGAEAVALDPGRAFRDQIEMDSVDFLSFVLALEHRLGCRIPELDYPLLSSLDGALGYLTAPTTTPPGDGVESRP